MRYTAQVFPSSFTQVERVVGFLFRIISRPGWRGLTFIWCYLLVFSQLVPHWNFHVLHTADPTINKSLLRSEGKLWLFYTHCFTDWLAPLIKILVYSPDWFASSVDAKCVERGKLKPCEIKLNLKLKLKYRLKFLWHPSSLLTTVTPE